MTAREWKEEALDGFLVAGVRVADRKAFELLVERWDPKLRAHARRLLGDQEQAREAVQDAWVEIVRGLNGLRDDAAFPAWAYRIVSRRCAKVIAGSQRRRQVAQTLAAEPAAAAPVVDRAEPTDLERLRKAVRELPPEQRAAVALFYFEGLSISETAIAMDIPAGTVKTRLMHARRKLRDTLEGD
ncbi:MAG: sigma-70 family RNA polymerase sigma factor [Acidobacteriota bacterium]|nr:sigma-70 family RNA polymerase sigma factor [Acidobacteriota bacterium]